MVQLHFFLFLFHFLSSFFFLRFIKWHKLFVNVLLHIKMTRRWLTLLMLWCWSEFFLLIKFFWYFIFPGRNSIRTTFEWNSIWSRSESIHELSIRNVIGFFFFFWVSFNGEHEQTLSSKNCFSRNRSEFDEKNKNVYFKIGITFFFFSIFPNCMRSTFERFPSEIGRSQHCVIPDS